MAIAIITSFGQQCDSNGVPLGSGTVTVYAAGTTTPLTLYPNSDLTGSTTNPITLDSSGRHAMAYIATAAYKIVVKNSAGTTIYTRDNIDPGVAVGSGALPVANGGTAATTAAGARTNLSAAAATDMATAQSDIANLNTWAGYTLTTKSRMASGTTAQQPAAGTVGAHRWNSTTSAPEMDNGAAWKKIALEGSIDQSYFASSSGVLCLQRSRTTHATAQTITATIPNDNTIPLNSEGTEITGFNVNFTTVNASSNVRIRSIVTFDPGSTVSVFALFVGSTCVDALDVVTGASGEDQQIELTHEYAPGAISVQNISVRAGTASGNLIISGTNTFGGTKKSVLIVEEWITK